MPDINCPGRGAGIEESRMRATQSPICARHCKCQTNIRQTSNIRIAKLIKNKDEHVVDDERVGVGKMQGVERLATQPKQSETQKVRKAMIRNDGRRRQI
jgi:hypothetical protein